MAQLGDLVRRIIREELDSLGIKSDRETIREIVREELSTALSGLIDATRGRSEPFYRTYYGYGRFRIGSSYPGYFG